MRASLLSGDIYKHRIHSMIQVDAAVEGDINNPDGPPPLHLH